MPSAAAASQHSTAPSSPSSGHVRLKLGLGSQNEPFQGVQGRFGQCAYICCRKASRLFVLSAKSARARNPESGLVFDNSYGVASELPRKSRGQIELQGVCLALGRISENNSGSDTAFTRPFDCAIFL